MSVWDSISSGAKKAGEVAATKTKIGKLKAEIVLLNREITNRQRAFGVVMYDHVAPLSQTQDFYAATDQLTELLRPPLIMAQKEIQALAAKKVKLKEQLAAAEANRAAAFPTKAESVGQKVMNFGKASYLHGGETKLKGELALVDRSIKGHKQKFGVVLFSLLVDAEDKKGYLPTDRQVRNIYDTCRGDIQRVEGKIKQKDELIVSLGGTSTLGKGFTCSETAHFSQTDSFQPPTESSLMSTAGGISNDQASSTNGVSYFDEPSTGRSMPNQSAFTDPNDLLL